MNLPDDRRYTENSLWVMEKGNGDVEIGVVEPATDIAKKFLFLEPADEGSRVEEGELLVEYEAMKRIGELLAPVTGEVVDVNKEVVDDPERIMKVPYENWIVRMEPEDPEDLDRLMGVEEAEEYYEEQV